MSIKKIRLVIFIVFFVSLGVSSIFLVTSFYKNKNILSANNYDQNNNEFNDFLEQKEDMPQADDQVTLIAVGDISYSRGIERIIKAKNDINYPFLKIKDYLNNADLVFGNLETPITPGLEIPDLQMIFRSNPDTALALKNANFSIVSLANNHTPNFGEKGLIDTFSYLSQLEIKYVGAGNNQDEAYQPAVLEKNGIKIAFLAYNDSDVVPTSYLASIDSAGTAFMDQSKLEKSIKKAKEEADFVIISMHSGTEYSSTPNDSQKIFAHKAIDYGADLVIGHHPHVVQTLEKYKDKYIFYSLGNFIFDQMGSEETKQGLMIKIYFSKKNINKISIIPTYTKSFGQPTIAILNEQEKILKELNFKFDNQDAYYWNKDIDNFDKITNPVLYLYTQKENSSFSKIRANDLNKNSTNEIYILENGHLTVKEDSTILWQSPDIWWIDNFELADSNNDGVTDLNLSLWRSGDYGSSKPFWVKENDMSIKNHFFIMDLKNNTFQQTWSSSNLSEPNCEFKIDDIDNDNKNELIVLEGDYSQAPSCNGKYLAVWSWEEWGFFNKWRSEKGNYSNLELETVEKQNRILVDKY